MDKKWITIGIVILLVGSFLIYTYILLSTPLCCGPNEYPSLYNELQSEVNNAWRSTEISKPFLFNLGDEISYICFANFQNTSLNGIEKYEDIEIYKHEDDNLFFISDKIDSEIKSNKIEHIDLEKITANQNPYCIKNPGEITISKTGRERLVTIQ